MVVGLGVHISGLEQEDRLLVWSVISPCEIGIGNTEIGIGGEEMELGEEGGSILLELPARREVGIRTGIGRIGIGGTVGPVERSSAKSRLAVWEETGREELVAVRRSRPSFLGLLESCHLRLRLTVRCLHLFPYSEQLTLLHVANLRSCV
jgi:hypothetical protein